MHSRSSLRRWIRVILPIAGACGQLVAWELVRALMVQFSTQLCQLGRNLDREGTARSGRQLLSRWLARPHWDPEAIYTNLRRMVRRQLLRGKRALLLVDTTVLGKRWIVLQVSTPWENRALPLYRLCYPYAGEKGKQGQAVDRAVEWLAENLPGRRSRYVLVMDRGFADSNLVRQLREGGWRFVIRARKNWTMTHRLFRGWMDDAALEGRVSCRPRMYREAALGWRHPRARAPDRRVRANVVHYHGPGHKEPWYLVTSERSARKAVEIYRERMKIEQEFRDLKGPLGLDELGNWYSQEPTFLAILAIYEWRLACLWLFDAVARFAKQMQAGGPLSWMRATREWVLRHLRSPKDMALAWL